MRKFFAIVCFSLWLGFSPSIYAQGSVDTLFCGDKLSASYDPASGEAPTDSFYVWIGNCLSRIRFDFSTANIPDAADIFYVDIEGNRFPAGSMPYFGGTCDTVANFFNDPLLPLSASLGVEYCLPGFLEIYGQGIPFQDSVFQRQALPSDFKLDGNWQESARLHLDIPDGIVALLFVVKFNADESTILEALWDCTPSCCIDASGNNVCAGEDIQLISEQEAISYQWTGPNGFISNEMSPSIANATKENEGWYVLEGSFLFDCLGVDSIYVEVYDPQVAINTDTTQICLGASTQLTASGALSYQWDQNTAGFVSVNAALATVSPIETTTYLVTGTDTNGCTSTASAVVIPTKLSIELNTNNPSCPGMSDGVIEINPLEGQAPYEIRLAGETWSSGTQLTGLPSGSHTFEVRDALGCLVFETTTLMEPEAVEVLVGTQAPSCKSACDGEVVIIPVGGQAPFSYFINASPNDSIVGGFCAGTYPLQVIDANGCDWSSAFTIEEPSAFSIDLGKNKKIKEGKTLSLEIEASTAVDSVIWHGLCEFDCDTKLSFQPDSSMTVVVSAWTASGCQATDSIYIRVKKKVKCHDGLYAPNAFSPNGDGLNEFFTLYADQEETDVVEIERLTIFNQWGNKVYDQSHLPPNQAQYGWDGTANGRAVIGGVYVWMATFLTDEDLRFRCNGSITVLR